jgi:hypothetical protein
MRDALTHVGLTDAAAPAPQPRSPCANPSGVHMKARQSSKIREIGDALVAMGYLALDEQAKALGLARSTAWTILQANHKSSGLSAALINRMLAAPQLPPRVRAIILEYVEEKVAGLYGHSKLQLRRFTTRLAERRVRDLRSKMAA